LPPPFFPISTNRTDPCISEAREKDIAAGKCYDRSRTIEIKKKIEHGNDTTQQQQPISLQKGCSKTKRKTQKHVRFVND